MSVLEHAHLKEHRRHHHRLIAMPNKALA